MGTETACGNYYNEPPAGPSATAMAGYYRMSSDESGPARSESLTDEELAQATVSASDCETDLDLHQTPQQQQHAASHQQPSPSRSHLQQHMQHGQHQHAHHTDTAGRTNHWAVSQQLQNHITTTNATVTGQVSVASSLMRLGHRKPREVGHGNRGRPLSQLATAGGSTVSGDTHPVPVDDNPISGK
uniref:Uncharacterized protein n=1 Tax=Anopheles farauti TaxID=69004 RepID=A0A182QA73_9DIPT